MASNQQTTAAAAPPTRISNFRPGGQAERLLLERRARLAAEAARVQEGGGDDDDDDDEEAAGDGGVEAGNGEEDDDDDDENNEPGRAPSTSPTPSRAATMLPAVAGPSVAHARTTAATTTTTPGQANGPNSRTRRPTYKRDYVDAHSHDTNFHHKGRGFWAEGLPADDALPTIAVQGPGALAWKARASANHKKR